MARDVAHMTPGAAGTSSDVGSEADRLRPEIAVSWHRSSLSGVPVDTFPHIPVEEDATDPDSQFLRVARPVLGRLCEEMADASMSVILTDPAAHILERRAGSRGLCDYLDQVVAVPGARYAEDVVGTNGLGTAAETRRSIVVSGIEHFAERLRGFTCVASPVIHPVTGRLLGILDITASCADASKLMVPVVTDAVREIQHRCCETVSAAERALFEEFVIASRRSRAALVSLNESFVMANDAALRMLSPEDHAMLWEQAARMVAAGSTSGVVRLPGDRTYRADLRHVTDGGFLVGALLRLHPRRTQPADGTAAGLPGLVGGSGPWLALSANVQLAARSRLAVAILGEAGSGKQAVARALHAAAGDPGDLQVLDAAEILSGEVRWFQAVRRTTIRPGTTVVLHAELLSPPQALALVAASREGPRRLVVTASEEWPALAPRRVVDTFPWRLQVPALRRRSEDIPNLASALASRHSSYPRETRFTLSALQCLARGEWPGNVRELESAVIQAVQRRPRGVITAEDLPARHRPTAPRRPLSVLEELERDAIVRALEDARGNKQAAAGTLGVSRSTLYRKIREYGLPDLGSAP